MTDEFKAAHNMLGMELSNGWKVVQKLERAKSGTGGIYAAYYVVVQGSRRGFLKAFDYSAVDKATDDVANITMEVTTAFHYEKEVLSRCAAHKIRNVIRLLETGWTSVTAAKVKSNPRVEYLILELAESGDCRTMLETDRADLKWKLHSLHLIASGLNQLHRAKIAHQDIKPSNIVNDHQEVSRISDFGSAYINDEVGNVPVHLTREYCGTFAYAPPELLYGMNGDFELRRRACDAYLLGNLIVYYFAKANMTALIRSNLDSKFCWTRPENRGRFSEVRVFVLDAFVKALCDFESELKRLSPELSETERCDLVFCVKHLCVPDPFERGHPKNHRELDSNFSLTRFVSILARMSKTYRWFQPAT